MQATTAYGKNNVTLYRTYAQPLGGLAPIPESAFVGRSNILFAVDINVQVHGDNFLPAYTHGDNRNVVATDTMKNFILQQALVYPGATLEGLLDFLGRQFLATYPQMQALRLTGHEVPFAAAPVPDEQGTGFAPSDVLFAAQRGDYSRATLEMARDGAGGRVTGHQCGHCDMRLIKLTGSSFANFARDVYTTLPERVDRPLYIYMDMHWRYRNVDDLLAPEPARYVAAAQVRDLAQTVFHQFVSLSIQHLLHEIGTRLLARCPQLAEVSLVAQNRLWDTAAEADSGSKVYCDPRPPYGQIELTLRPDGNGG